MVKVRVNAMTHQDKRDIGGRCESPIPCGGKAEVWDEKNQMWLCRQCHSKVTDAYFGMGDCDLDDEISYLKTA
jgi:hypothetical protein